MIRRAALDAIARDIGERQKYVDWQTVSKEDYDSVEVGGKIRRGRVVGKKVDAGRYMVQIEWRGP
jgi:hypothetical protein